MKYPKTQITRMVTFAEDDCRQVQFRIGRKWTYIFVQPDTKPMKVSNAEFENIIKGLK